MPGFKTMELKNVITYQNIILFLMAFAAYFEADTATTCAAVFLYGSGAESNPTVLAAFGSGGLAGFLLLKLALSLLIILPSFYLLIESSTRTMGMSALLAITIGGLVVSTNNLSAILTGISPLYILLGGCSFLQSGTVIGIIILVSGLVIYYLLNHRSNISSRHI